jgi:hypothetical protein
MIVGVMRGSRLRAVAVLLAILAGSQLGHAIVYLARYGLDAGRLQSTGVHSYLPALAGVLSGVLGVLLMTSLLVVAAARALEPAHAGWRRRATLRFFDLLPALFAAQLLVFVVQETIEGLAAGGGHLPSVVEVLFWGTLGQLPAAAVAAAAVAWLLARLEAAWTVLVGGVARLIHEPAPALQRAIRPEPAPARRLASTFPSAFRKRGPPALLDPVVAS